VNVKALLVGAVVTCLALPTGAADAPLLRVYLPRNVSVEGDALTLGTITIIMCDDMETATKASAVAMGRAPWSRESLVIDRTTILSRLAGSGIPAARAQFSGADKVTVRRSERTVGKEELLKLVEAFLLKTRPASDDSRLQLIRDPNELVLPEGKDIALKPRLSDGAPAGHVKVEIGAFCDGNEVAAAHALFKVVYPLRQAVAIKDIPTGATIAAENAKVEVITADRRQTGEWVSPFGMVALQRVPAGTVIRPSALMSPRPGLVVKRNQGVTMRLEGLGFKITALGEALDDGKCGDFIKVRNADTKRVVTAKVAPDGSVEPVFEEEKK